MAGSRILKIMDHEEIAPQQNEASAATIKEGKIEFRNVTFSYDGEHHVLKTLVSLLIQVKLWL